MNKKLLVLVLSASLLASCGITIKWNESSASNATSDVVTSGLSSETSEGTVLVTSIDVTGIPATMDVNETATIGVTVLPENATNPKYTITSSDKKVVDVSNGVITAYSAGTATITVSAEDESGISKSFDITVLAPINAPTEWEGAKALIKNAVADVSNINGYSYSESSESYTNGKRSYIKNTTKKYQYGVNGDVCYTGEYKYIDDETAITPLAGFKGIVGEKYVQYEHTDSIYDYVNKSTDISDSFTAEQAIEDAQKIVQMTDMLGITESSYNWFGDAAYEYSSEDGIITMKYTHQYDSSSYSRKGDFTVKVTKYGKFISAALNNYDYSDAEFTTPRLVYTYELTVDEGDKFSSLSISPSDFFLSENHSVTVSTSLNGDGTEVVAGNRLYVTGHDETKPYAIDWTDEDFTIVSSSNEAVVGHKAGGYGDYWFALSAGESTLTIKHNNTNKEHQIVVTSVAPAASRFESVSSSKGVQFSVGTTTEFTASITPAEASQEFVVESSDSEVLSVEKRDGKWYGTGLKEGNVTVTFKDAAGVATTSSLDITITAKEAEKAAYEGTWVSGTNEMVVNSNGTGTWNGISFTFTYNASTGVGKMSDVGAFTDGENTFTYNAAKDTMTIYLSDEYGDNVYTTTMTRKAEEVAKPYVGTWKSGSNTMVLQKNGNGTWETYSFTFTYTESTGKGVMSNFAAFTDDDNYFIYNSTADTISVHLSGDYGDNVFNTTMTRA